MAADENGDVRCKGCGKLLGKIQDGLFVVKRKDLDFTVDAEGQVIIQCPTPKCYRKRIIRVSCQQSA